jgi:hypothetical protein
MHGIASNAQCECTLTANDRMEPPNVQPRFTFNVQSPCKDCAKSKKELRIYRRVFRYRNLLESVTVWHWLYSSGKVGSYSACQQTMLLAICTMSDSMFGYDHFS